MTRIVGVVLATCVGLAGLAADSSRSATPATDAVVTVGDIPTVALNPGDSAVVVVPVHIAAGYHVQANPASGEFLIPMELRLHIDPPDTLISWELIYPAPGTFRLEGTTDDLLTYHDSVDVRVSIHASATAPRGERRFTGTLSYQACDTRRCLFPAAVPVGFTVAVSEE